VLAAMEAFTSREDDTHAWLVLEVVYLKRGVLKDWGENGDNEEKLQCRLNFECLWHVFRVHDILFVGPSDMQLHFMPSKVYCRSIKTDFRSLEDLELAAGKSIQRDTSIVESPG
jgi:hypothetical protein